MVTTPHIRSYRKTTFIYFHHIGIAWLDSQVFRLISVYAVRDALLLFYPASLVWKMVSRDLELENIYCSPDDASVKWHNLKSAFLSGEDGPHI